MRLLTAFNREELLQTQYPIIVECWDHKSYGRGKRRWLAEFTQAERDKAAKLYRDKLCRWHLVQGTPDEALLSLHTYEFIKRLVNFFASI